MNFKREFDEIFDEITESLIDNKPAYPTHDDRVKYNKLYIKKVDEFEKVMDAKVQEFLIPPKEADMIQYVDRLRKQLQGAEFSQI